MIIINKKEILLTNGTFNKNHAKVTKANFRNGGFYDPMDIVQVRYEMIRDADVSTGTIEQVSNEYGYSRASYYHIRDNFENGGMAALIPDKTGPREPRKFTDEIQEYVNDYIGRNPSASSSQIADEIESSKGVTVSKRTVERFRHKKKP